MTWTLSSFTESVAAGLVTAVILATALGAWAWVRKAPGYTVATIGLVAFAAVLTILNQLAGIQSRGNVKGSEVTLGRQIDAVADSFRILQWVPSNTECNAVVDVSQASPSVRDKYDVAIACGINDPKTDKFKDARITISPPFTIQSGAIQIVASSRKEMADGIAEERERALRNSPYPKGTSLTVSQLMWFRVVLLPKGTNVSELRRLSDVLLHGGAVAKSEVAASLVVTKIK